MNLAACYLAVALCAGVSNPPPAPRLQITQSEDGNVACGSASPTGRCKGVFWLRGRRIATTWQWVDVVLPHEMLHALGFDHDKHGVWLGPKSSRLAKCEDARLYLDCPQPIDAKAQRFFGPFTCELP
jgi:hypothetical protein